MVVIVDDPSKGIAEGNLVVHEGQGPCKHLQGDKPGAYSCALHNELWYEETPCFAHGQFEQRPDTPCRMGAYILAKEKTDDAECAECVG